MQHLDKTIATYFWKQLKHLKHTLATYVYSHCNICNFQINSYNLQHENTCCNIRLKYLEYTLATYVKHIQHPDQNTCKYTSETEMKHFEQSLATFSWNTCNICNIPIYFCNIHMKHLQHTSETSKTHESNISMLLGRMEARRSVEFNGGSGPATTSARRGKEAAPTRLGEGSRSAREPLMLALPRLSARDRGHRHRCTVVSRAARASLSWPTHAEATAHIEAIAPPCQDAHPHHRERERE
jgi:hypothetical protein